MGTSQARVRHGSQGQVNCRVAEGWTRVTASAPAAARVRKRAGQGWADVGDDVVTRDVPRAARGQCRFWQGACASAEHGDERACFGRDYRLRARKR